LIGLINRDQAQPDLIRPDWESILVMCQSAEMPKMVHCCCAMLAQMNQKMVNMNTTMSLTAIDKRLMMKQAIALALLTLSQCVP
jgi:hypothetical protein